MIDSRHPGRPGGRLVYNTLLNLAGLGVPFVVAVFAIPPLISRLGTDRFGILTLVWVVVSYLGLFDLGLGRALTQHLSEKLGRGEIDELPVLAWTALALMLLLGLLVGLAIIAITPWTVERAIKIPEAYRVDAKQAFYVIAASLPFVTTTVGLRGILESYQEFGAINAIRLPLGAFTFLGPLAVTYVSVNLSAISATLVAARIVAWAWHVYFCLKRTPALRISRRLEGKFVKPLIASGGWMTVSSVIGPFIAYIDRFVIGAVVSVAAVTYYVTPNEMITKLWIIPGALTGVLFPVFAAQSGARRVLFKDLLFRSSKYLFLILFPLSLAIVLFAPEILGIWLGPVFSRQSSHVLQWLTIGVTANCLAQIPFTLIQGVGQSGVTAKIHLAELAPYSLAMILGVYLGGINGAAIVWTIRALLDMLLMYAWANRTLGLRASPEPKLVGFLLLISGAFAAAFIMRTTDAKWIFLLSSLSGIFWVYWRGILDSGDRRALLDVRVRLADRSSWNQL
jgi:O-antigen/teichoic acid export membrane protein